MFIKKLLIVILSITCNSTFAMDDNYDFETACQKPCENTDNNTIQNNTGTTQQNTFNKKQEELGKISNKLYENFDEAYKAVFGKKINSLNNNNEVLQKNNNTSNITQQKLEEIQKSIDNININDKK